MARLIINASDGKRGLFEITKPVTTIGRGDANDLVLHDPSVSRFHAVIKLFEDGTLSIADRDSMNGVVIDGARITDEVPLHDRLNLQIGNFELRFETGDDSGLVVNAAKMPSGVQDVLRGYAPEGPETPARGTLEELVDQIRHLEKEKYLLSALYDAGKALHSKLTIDDITFEVISLVLRIESVERAFLMLLDENGDVASQSDVWYRNPQPVDTRRISLSRTIFDHLRQHREPVLIHDATADERFSGSESMKLTGLRSAMAAPLVSNNRLLGILYADNLRRASAFTQDELNILALVAAQAAAAIGTADAHKLLAEQSLRRSVLERFLAPEVVEMIAKNPEDIKLGGANQKVTILFTDIRGFTTLSEKLPPQKVVEILNEYFTRMSDVVFDNFGTIDKFLGDGLMALFGAPLSKGDDAANAVRAAIQMQRLLLQMNRDAQARGWPELQIGIGINTGIVVAGNIGSPKRLDYTVIGDEVNVASRLMSAASAGQILVSESTAKELDDSFKLSGSKPVLLKGKSSPTPVSSVRWMDSAKKAAQ